MTARRYDVHGVGLRFETNDERVADAVHERFRHFASERGREDLVFEFVVGDGEPPTPPEEPGRPVYEPAEGTVTYHPAADVLFIRHGDAALTSSPAEGATHAVSRSADGEALWRLSRPFVTLPLIESLKRRGLWSVHAAAASIDGRGILVAGGSGAGKTTTALALARAGFDLLGDDMVFLALDGERLVARAFPDPFDLTDATIALVPEVTANAAARNGWPKKQLDAGVVAQLATTCVPEVLLVATVGGGATRLEPIDADDALIALSPNVLLTEPGSSQRHLDALGGLARSARCYRAELGRDLAELAARLRAALLGN